VVGGLRIQCLFAIFQIQRNTQRDKLKDYSFKFIWSENDQGFIQKLHEIQY